MQKLISYAQNFEDIMLWRALRDVQDGCYVDVGAQSPDTDSVSRLFHEHGWRGVHVEPTPGYANLLRERRSDEVVLQVAVSDKPGILRFFDIAQSGLSTTDAAIAAGHREAGFEVREIQVPAVTLDTVLDQIADREVHWLKIDVEGAEEALLQGSLDWLARVGLKGFEHHAPWQLSGGMKQRVALARAWLPGPDVLLLDEPFGALDAQTRLMMQELLREAWLETGTTLLFVTHDVEEALFLADRILIMSARPGKIVEEIVLPFGRDRDIENLAGHPQYGEIKQHVLHRVRLEAKRHLS